MRPLYRFFYHMVGLELLLHDIKVVGQNNVPPEGGCLIASNHVSFMDPTTVGWAVAREIHYLGRKSLFKPPFWSWFLPICNVMPIDRDGHDIAGLRSIIKMLKGGQPVLLFPEGTRSPDGKIQRSEPGAGFIALKAAVPVLPVRVFGTFESLSRQAKWLRFRPIRVVIGEPYLPAIPEGRKEKESYAAVAQGMMDRISLLH